MMKVGIDTVEISRIEKLYLKEKKVFLDRVFTKKEKGCTVKHTGPLAVKIILARLVGLSRLTDTN